MVVDLSKLFTGNILVQVIAFSLMPLVTRIYSPDQLGIYQTITTFSLVVSPFVGLSLSHALIKQKDDLIYKEVLFAAAVSALGSSLLFTLLFCIVAFNVFEDISVNVGHALLFFFLCFSSALYGFSKTNFLRLGKYGQSSIYDVICSLLGNSSKILLGAVSPSSIMLIASLIIGNVAAIIYGAVGNYNFLKKSFKIPGLKGIFRILTDFSGFTIHLTLSQFLSILLGWHLVIFAPVFTTAFEIGFLSLAIMAVKTPSFPFLASISNYVYAESSKARNDGVPFNQILVKPSVLGFIGTALVLVTLVFAGPQLFGVIFGSEWSEAAAYAVYIALPLVPAFALSPAYKCWANIYERQQCLIVVDVACVVLVFVSASVVYLFDMAFKSFVLFGAILLFLSHVFKFYFLYNVQKNE